MSRERAGNDHQVRPAREVGNPRSRDSVGFPDEEVGAQIADESIEVGRMDEAEPNVRFRHRPGRLGGDLVDALWNGKTGVVAKPAYLHGRHRMAELAKPGEVAAAYPRPAGGGPQKSLVENRGISGVHGCSRLMSWFFASLFIAYACALCGSPLRRGRLAVGPHNLLTFLVPMA